MSVEEVSMGSSLSRIMIAASFIGFVSPSFTLAAPASGGPGVTPHWAEGEKSFLGTSATSTSRVYFTGSRNTLTEVFYPVLDTANVEDSQFLVGDSAGTWVDEEKVQSPNYLVTSLDNRAMLWRVSTWNNGHNWRLIKHIFTDPARNTLVQRVTLETLNGRTPNQFQIYYLHNPSMDLSGMGDTGTTVVSGGRTYLVASQGSRFSALTVSSGWQVNGGVTMVSNGFVGVNDGWTDLLGSGSDCSAGNRTMDCTYDSAINGNIAQMGWISTGPSGGSSYSFDVVIGFGTTEVNAIAAANGTLTAGTAAAETNYVSEWHTYTNTLNSQGGTADDEYYLSAMTLKTSQDKSNGAMIAGFGTPWGRNRGDTGDFGPEGGYHLVWARDLYKFSSALITAGDTTSANSAIDYLFNVQMNQTTGRFPANSWISGVQYFPTHQMDAQAMPIVLAWKLGRNDLWPKVQLAADFITNTANGAPRTEKDRWEETGGYSPGTIGALVAGLVCAAEIARANGDLTRARNYYATADNWQRNVDPWTFTTMGEYGNGRYYLRIDDDRDPNDNDDITIANVPKDDENHKEKKILDTSFTELVRMGAKRPTAPNILDGFPEVDANIRQSISGKGVSWFRYNHDGYGESNTGADWPNNKTGRGRLWPILTAERGMYEIARTGVGSNGSSYLTALRNFATPQGFIPEQVWNNTVTLTGDWQTTLPPGYTAGTPTKSIAPLNWAMGEYINLFASIRANRAVDIPAVVCARYDACTLAIPSGQARVTFRANATTSFGQSVYVTGNIAALGGWDPGLAVPVNTETDLYPIWRNAVNLPAATAIQYKYIRKNTDDSITWENLPSGGNRSMTTPASGGNVTRNDTIVWP